jgi:hypothetical protein
MGLLVLLLALFSGLRPSSRRLRLGFLASDVALSVTLVLLGLALFDEIAVACHGADSFLYLALDALDDAFDAFSGPTILSHALLLVFGWTFHLKRTDRCDVGRLSAVTL